MDKLLAVLKMFPQILGTVVAINATLKGLPGESKMKVLLSAVSVGAAIMKTTDFKPVEVAATLAEKVVGALNETGYFSHAGTVGIQDQTPAPAAASDGETTPILDAA